MAKHVIIEAYTFTPATKTIVVTGKQIRREQLLLITNTTTGTVVYNFSDPSLGAASYSTAVNTSTGLETTTIVLTYNTGAMNASDKMSILVEESYYEFYPNEVMRDPVDKLRVSNPESLIDADFEYSTQPTKWDTVNLLNNRPSAFYNVINPVTGITNITSSGNRITVALSLTAGLAVGQPIFLQGSLDEANADGWWIIDAIVTNTNFSFVVTTSPAASLFDATKSYIWAGAFFSNAAISTASITTSGNTEIIVATTNAHGLRKGDYVYVTGTTGVTGGPVNGTYEINTTPATHIFTYTTGSAASGTITLAAGATGTLYPRSAGFVEHRPFDGGVQFSNVTTAHGYQLIRQTRRNFRYQAGKGIQFSTGTTLKPPLSVESVTSSGTTVTVITKFAHGLNTGAQVRVQGIDQAAYNGTFTVSAIINNTQFQYIAGSIPSKTPADGFPITITPAQWYGSSNRVGMFDNQNGFYLEFDGQNINCVRRTSTDYLSGTAAVTVGSPTITGTNTIWSEQLKPGDYIVIRGMSYLVQTILSDTSMTIYPEYRGAVSAVRCVVSKTINTIYPQSTWNIDKCDGTGASGYTIDTTKMQMIYADYTWYGAGAIRFGFKNNRGEVIYCHRIPNNNLNTKAYFRSGNLPARYETNTIPPYTYITATVANNVTTGGSIFCNSLAGFPPSGTVVLRQPKDIGGGIEYISYSAITGAGNVLTVASRTVAGGNVAPQNFTFSQTAPTHVELYSPQVSSTISHWGTSVIMDGQFDDDKSYVFNVGMLQNQVAANLALNTRYPLISLRIAPTVDNGLTGLLGAREIVNRLQLTLRSMDAFTTGSSFRIELILNGNPTGGTFIPVGGSSLAQYALHTGGQTISGGESIYSFFTNIGNATSQDIQLVRDIGNSILAGGVSNAVPTGSTGLYPDGPDVITLTATPVTSSVNTINARISWTETQA
jgi:hypothetical protein